MVVERLRMLKMPGSQETTARLFSPQFLVSCSICIMIPASAVVLVLAGSFINGVTVLATTLRRLEAMALFSEPVVESEL